MASSTDDLQNNLDSYVLQLNTVEAALSNDPENDELLKLQNDLQEVIELTKTLLEQSQADGLDADHNDETGISKKGKGSWKAGDACQAMWSDDGKYYNATVQEINEDGKVVVSFPSYDTTDITEVSLLRPPSDENEESSGKRNPLILSESDKKLLLSRREKLIAEREAKKKKNVKKKERLQRLVQQREEEKTKWQQFNKKTFSKTKKGQVKKSIFASPTSVDGRVGVGTCGIADAPMTKTQSSEKYKSVKPH